RSASVGWGALFGGMSFAFTRASARFQCSVKAACPGVLRAGEKLTPPRVGRRFWWQGKQYFVMNGVTLSRKNWSASAFRIS
ncbi:MAG: hypothetical protein B7Z55_07035, partial [Planctomycetales bacterium 12-60-4]